MVNFQLTANDHVASPLSGSATTTTQYWDEQLHRIRATRRQVAATTTSAATVTVNDTAVTGSQVVLAGCVAVHLLWHPQTIFCAGRPEMFTDLKLTMVSADHLSANLP